MPDGDEIVNELLERWLEEEPDPVDVFEDRLAVNLGLQRHPNTPIDKWRAARVQAIDSAGLD